MCARPGREIQEDHPRPQTETPRSKTMVAPRLLDHAWVGMGVTFLNVNISSFYDGSMNNYHREEYQDEIPDCDSTPIAYACIEWKICRCGVREEITQLDCECRESHPD